MEFFIRIAEKFILANRRLRKLKRAVSVMMAITVFVTTYALILPAITLEKETASAQPGIEIAASDKRVARILRKIDARIARDAASRESSGQTANQNVAVAAKGA